MKRVSLRNVDKAANHITKTVTSRRSKSKRKTPGKILWETFDHFSLNQAEICRKTKFLAETFPAEYKEVAQDQLSRYINGHSPDMMGAALRAVIASMPATAQTYYQSLISFNEIEAQKEIDSSFESWLIRKCRTA